MIDADALRQRREEIGDLIHRRRLACGYTLEDVGRAAGYPPRTAQAMLTRIEQGRRALTADRIRAVADLLSLPVALLVP